MRIGPRAQAVIGPLLSECPTSDAPVFAYQRRKDGPRLVITVGGYAGRVKASCKLAGVPHWHPHQLRHNFATEVQRRYESDHAAAAAIGDTPEVARQVYADSPEDAVAFRVAMEMG